MTFAQFKKALPGIKRKMQGWPYKVIIFDEVMQTALESAAAEKK